MRKTSFVALLVAVAMMIPVGVFASHQFNDVPDSHTFHNAIAWMKDNNITVGCNPPANNRYCPSNNVTRGEMAAFMKRLAENNVVDAATLDGVDSTEFATSADNAAYHTALDGFVNLALTNTNIRTLSLPAGSYVVIAEGVANNNDTVKATVLCTLTVGTAHDDFEIGETLDIQNEDDRDSFVLIVATDLAAPTDATLVCSSSTTSSNIVNPSITATRVSGSVVVSGDIAGSSGDSEG